MFKHRFRRCKLNVKIWKLWNLEYVVAKQHFKVPGCRCRSCEVAVSKISSSNLLYLCLFFFLLNKQQQQQMWSLCDLQSTYVLLTCIYWPLKANSSHWGWHLWCIGKLITPSKPSTVHTPIAHSWHKRQGWMCGEMDGSMKATTRLAVERISASVTCWSTVNNSCKFHTWW